MNPGIEEINSKVRKYLDLYFVTIVDAKIDDEIQKMLGIIEEIEAFYKRPIEKTSYHETIASYKSQLHKIIDSFWVKPENSQFSDHYNPLIESLKSIIEPLETSQSREQKMLRFYADQGDPAFIKFLKPLKRILFKTSTVPKRLIKLFKKQKSSIPYWQHTIPYKNLAEKYFLTEVIFALSKLADHVFPVFCKIYIEIKHQEVELEDVSSKTKSEIFSSIVKQIESLKATQIEKINKSLDQILDKCTEAFIIDFDRCGTIEFSNRKLSGTRNEKYFKEAVTTWAKYNREWQNTIYALFEDWRTDLDIHALKHKTLAEFNDFQVAKTMKLQESIAPKIIEIREFITQGIDSLSNEETAVQKELKRINYLASKKLDKELVPQLSESLSNQPISNLVNKLESSIRNSVEVLSNEHVIVKSNAYDSPIKTEELHKVSPYELIVFETLPKFQNELNAIKKALFNAFELATAETADLDHIVTFSFTSAINAMEEGGKSEEEARSIALNGLKRALNRLDESNQKLEELLARISMDLEKSIHRFCDQIIELTFNENVRELRLRIAKAKATEQARKTFWQYQKKFIIKKGEFQNFASKSFESTLRFIRSISNRFILTAKKPVLTKQVSDFLLEYQHSMSTLPIIYKKLYQIEPLQDLELFEGRVFEFEVFQKAFQSWEKGRFSATVILGEKWGGLTTFLNYATHHSNLPYPIKRFAPQKNIYSEEMLIRLMQDVFGNNEFENLDQVEAYLKSGSKKIVIIEDMQNLYLRKVGGFKTLQLLFQLMSNTYNHVFWITTSTIYAWQYLAKTIHIPEYFSYIIEMKELTHEQVINIIWKRNKISGFSILFDAGEDNMSDKKFLKLSEEERQQLLKKEFFTSLNNFAKSNVSLALIYWLLSTKHVDENTITIGSFKNPDLNFLNILSMDKIHILHALIIHDGLTELQLNEVLYTTNITIKLLLIELLQDGILLQKDDVLMVNPIIYRTLISLLKSKNLIH